MNDERCGKLEKMREIMKKKQKEKEKEKEKERENYKIPIINNNSSTFI